VNQKGQVFQRAGFATLVVLIPISIILLAGSVGLVKVKQIDDQIASNQREVLEEMDGLSKTTIQYKAYKTKAEEYKEKGVDISEVATQTTNVADSIRQENFTKAQKIIHSLDQKLEQLLAQQEEADRKVTEEQKNELERKLNDYRQKGIDVKVVDQSLPEVRNLIDQKEYSKVRDKIRVLTKQLDLLYAQKQEQDRIAEEKRKQAEEAQRQFQANQQVNAYSLYERKTVVTSHGSFSVDVLIINLGNPSLRVITDTANDDDCFDNCPTKSLMAYVQQYGGFAGVHGTYFCPPDYVQCAGKVASFDFPVYNTRLGKFINASKLFWSGRAIVAFDASNKAYFFREANSFGGVNVKAAIVNYPALLANGQIVVNEAAYSAKGTRGAIGFKGHLLYLAIGRNASIADMAYVLQALGAENAMNLDGGGSVAMVYNGAYKVGPGRNLPNAIIFAQ
jgi:hypothetical protein